MNVMKIKKSIARQDMRYWNRVFRQMQTHIEQHLDKVLRLESEARGEPLREDEIEEIKEAERFRLSQNPEEELLFMEEAILDMPIGYRPLVDPKTEYKVFKSKWIETTTDKDSNPIKVVKTDTLVDDIKNHKKMKKWDLKNKKRTHSRDRRKKNNLIQREIPQKFLKRIKRFRKKNAEVMERISGN